MRGKIKRNKKILENYKQELNKIENMDNTKSIDNNSKKNNKVVSTIFIIIVIIFSIIIYINGEKIKVIGNWGYIGVMLACFIANASVLFPAPSILIAFSMSSIYPKEIVSLFAAIGMATGELVGYITGKLGANIIKEKQNSKIWNFANKHENIAIFLFALLPLPIFDVIGMVAGYMKMNLFKFWILCFLGKFLKVLVYLFAGNYLIKLGFNIG